MSLKKSIFWSYFTRYIDVLLQFGSSLFIARLLTPEEIGTFSVAFSLIGFAILIREFGIGEYLVQEKHLNTIKIRTAFSLGLLFSWTLAVIVFLSAEVIAGFYNKPELLPMIQIISIIFLFIPFNSIVFSLLRRKMQFHLRSIIEISSGVSNAITAVFLAYQGFGAFSLVWAYVVNTLVVFLLCWLLRPAEFSVGLSLKEYRTILSFGSFSSMGQIINHAGNSAPDIFIGKFLGMTSVGFFNKGTALLAMARKILLDGLRPVLLPYFSQIHRNKDKPVKAYLAVLNLTMAFIWPSYAFLVMKAEVLIELFFGSQWQSSVPILQILGLGGMVGIIAVFADELFKATGHIKKFFMVEIIMTPLRVLAVIIGVQYNLLTIATLLAVLSFLRLAITYTLIYHYFQIDFGAFFKMLFKNVVLLVFCISPLFITQYYTLFESIYLRLFFDAMLITLIWILGMYLLNKEVILKIISSLKSR